MTLKLQFVIEAIDNATKKLKAINQEVDKQPRFWKLARAASREFFHEAGWGKVQRQMDAVRERGAALVGWGRQASAVMLGVGAAGAAAFFGVKRLADEVDKLADTAAALSMTTQQLQRAGFAAQMNGSSVDELSQSLVFLNKNMATAREGNAEMVQWMRRAGVTSADLRNRNFTAADAMERMADTFEKVGDKGDNGQKKIALTTQLMGRQGFRMIQLLNGGSAALRGFYAEADRLGVTLDNRPVKSMTSFNDSWDRLRLVAFGAAAAAGGPVVNVLQRVAERVTAWTAANRGLIETKVEAFMARVEQRLPAIWTGVEKTARAAVDFFSAANSVAQALGGWGAALKIVGYLIAGKFLLDLGLVLWTVGSLVVKSAMLAKVLGLIAAGFAAATLPVWILGGALIAAGALVMAYWEPISKFFSDLWAKVKKITSAVGIDLGFGAGSGDRLTSPVGVSGIPAGGMNRVGGELKISIAGMPARVESLRKTAGSLLDLSVDTGPVMAGAY